MKYDQGMFFIGFVQFIRVFMCVCIYAPESYITDTTCFYVFVFCALAMTHGRYTVLPREHKWTHAESNLTLLQIFAFLFAHTHWAMPLNLFLWFGFIVSCTRFKPHFPSAFCKPVHATTKKISRVMLAKRPCKWGGTFQTPHTYQIITDKWVKDIVC